MMLQNEVFCDWGHMTAPLSTFCRTHVQLGDLKDGEEVKRAASGPSRRISQNFQHREEHGVRSSVRCEGTQSDGGTEKKPAELRERVLHRRQGSNCISYVLEHTLTPPILCPLLTDEKKEEKKKTTDKSTKSKTQTHIRIGLHGFRRALYLAKSN